MIFRDIGDAARDEPLDHQAHLRDMLSRARLDGGGERAERAHVFVELALGRLRHLGDRLVERQGRMVTLGPRVDLVIDVGDITDIDDAICAVDVSQQSEQHVENDDRPGVADMGIIVDGRAADIEPDGPRVDRREVLLAAGQRVVKPKRHRPLRPLSGRARSFGLVGCLVDFIANSGQRRLVV